jgi:hypothetical protein
MKLDDVNLGITSVCLDGFDTAEIIRPQPPTAHDLGQRRTDDLTRDRRERYRFRGSDTLGSLGSATTAVSEPVELRGGAVSGPVTCWHRTRSFCAPGLRQTEWGIDTPVRRSAV